MNTANSSTEMVHDESQSDSPTGVIYLAAPLSMYRSSLYDDVIAWLQEEFPEYRLLLSRDLFLSNAHFLATYRTALAEVTLSVTLTDHDGWVGRGVYTEAQFLAPRGVGGAVVLPNGEVWSEISLVVGNVENWRRFAYVLDHRTKRRSIDVMRESRKHARSEHRR